MDDSDSGMNPRRRTAGSGSRAGISQGALVELIKHRRGRLIASRRLFFIWSPRKHDQRKQCIYTE